MSEDKQVMEMVNDHAAKLQAEGKTVRNWKEQPLNADYIRVGQLLCDEHVTKERRTVRESGPYNDRAVRALLVAVIKALLWVLLGLVVLSMALGGYAGIVAAACVCQCIAQAVVRVDRYFRKR